MGDLTLVTADITSPAVVPREGSRRRMIMAEASSITSMGTSGNVGGALVHIEVVVDAWVQTNVACVKVKPRRSRLPSDSQLARPRVPSAHPPPSVAVGPGQALWQPLMVAPNWP